jgi:hypothetical protein
MARKARFVLRYTLTPNARGTVHRHYGKWREEQKMPRRCDNDECLFHTEPLVWNGKPLSLVLDHRNGNNSDNRPQNLRLLCPNCDSQLETRGGRNKGRVEKHEGGFAIIRSNGNKDYHWPVESGDAQYRGYALTTQIAPTKKSAAQSDVKL